MTTTTKNVKSLGEKHGMELVGQWDWRNDGAAPVCVDTAQSDARIALERAEIDESQVDQYVIAHIVGQEDEIARRRAGPARGIIG